MTNIEDLNIDTIDGEIWEQVKEFPKYLVSNLGRVYSFYHKKVLKSTVTGADKSYLEVKLTADKVAQHIKVHRLVAKAFLSNPDNKPQVHHIDNNSWNNRADNLMWVTLEEHKQIHREMRGANNNE